MAKKKMHTLATLHRFDDAAVGLNMHYLEVQPDVYAAFHTETKKPVRCLVRIGSDVQWHCALHHLKDKPGFGYITITIALVKKLGLSRNASVKISLETDASELGGPMAEELEELLRQDVVGRKCFDALSPGKKRNIMFFVYSAKTSTTRLSRAIRLIRNLKMFPPGEADIGEVFRRK